MGSLKLSDVSDSFAKLLSHSIFYEYSILKNINFLKTAYNKFWGQVDEYTTLWNEIPKLKEVHDVFFKYKIFNFEISLKILFVYILILSLFNYSLIF